MKDKTLAALIVGCAVADACYPATKRARLFISPSVSRITSLWVFRFTTFSIIQEQAAFNGSLTYDVNRRLMSAITYAGSTPDSIHRFFL